MKRQISLAVMVLTASFSAFAAEPVTTTPPTKTSINKVATATDQSPTKMTLNGHTKAVIEANGERHRIEGRISGYLRGDAKQIAAGQLQVGGLNLVFNEVPVSSLSGEKTENTAGLGFAIEPGQQLEYDAKQGIIKGRLKGQLDTGHLLRYAKPEPDAEREDDHRIPTQSARVNVEIQLARPIDEKTGTSDVETLGAEMRLTLDADALPDYRLQNYRIDITATPLELEVVQLFWIAWRCSLPTATCPVIATAVALPWAAAPAAPKLFPPTRTPITAST